MEWSNIEFVEISIFKRDPNFVCMFCAAVASVLETSHIPNIWMRATMANEMSVAHWTMEPVTVITDDNEVAEMDLFTNIARL